MSLSYTDTGTPSLIWVVAVCGSVGLHLGIPAFFLAAPRTAETPHVQDASATGAILFDLSDVIAAPSDAGEDSAAQTASVAAPTVTESAEAVDPAKAADEPVLNQVPYDVEDDELKFGVASPEPAEDTQETADETATEFDEEKVDQDSALGAEDADASAASVSGQDAQEVAEKATASSEGLSAEQKNEIQDWQKSVVIAIAKAKSYPKKARAQKIQGTVSVAFTLDAYGRLIGHAVKESSGWPILDAAALAIFDKIEKFPTPPNFLDETAFTLLVPINYSVK